MQGAKIAGGNPKNERVQDDYYATDPSAVNMLLDAHPMRGTSFLEPCVGGGHVANAVLRRIGEISDATYLDIIDRGYPGTVVQNFLEWNEDKKYDLIITNPPYSLAGEFVEKGMSVLNDGGCMALFLKIQFLEGEKRAGIFNRHPPKYIYVFRKRIATWNNGNSVNPETGKRWATTFCHAWFVWEQGFHGEPVVRWL